MNGQVVTLSVASQALAGERQVNVYLPGGYERGRERYPVVFLFRGHEREWVNPDEDDSRGGRTAATVADELIRAGRIGPVILVMPGLASDDNSVPGLGVNFVSPGLTDAPGVGPGRYADFLVGEVIPAVDRAYRTLADRQYRAADGFSLGGFTALSVALRYPELFASVGAFDGTFFFADRRRPDGSEDTLARVSLLHPAFGDPLDEERFRAVNPADLIQSQSAERLGSMAFHIHTAPEAMEPNAANFFRGKALIDGLKARGVANSFEPFVLEGSRHNWHWADEHLALSLPKHFEVFNRI